MKYAISLIFVLSAHFAFAEGTCVSQSDAGAHEGFCANLNKQACATHSSLCTWEKAKVKTMKIIDGKNTRTVKVIETIDHNCTAKDGMEAHENFCASQPKAACAVHSVCEWQ